MVESGTDSSLWDAVPVESAPGWNELPAVLDRIERATDCWVNERAAHFDPFRWGEVEGERVHRRKAFNEAALNLDVARRLGYHDAAPDLQELVVTAANNQRYAHLVRRHPRQFVRYAYAALYVDEWADLDPTLAAAVEESLDAGLPATVEREPFFDVMLWQFCENYGYDDYRTDPIAALKASCVCRGVSPVRATAGDAYALTHDVLFGRDFGFASESPLDAVDTTALESATNALVLRFAAEEDWDVVLELLMAGVVEDAVAPDVVRFALGCIAEAVDRHGYVPGPRSPEAAASTGGSVAGRDDSVEFEDWSGANEHWVTNYHPNLVAGSAVRLLRERWLADRDGLDVPAVEYHRFGQVLRSLAAYDLKTGARRFEALHGSSVLDRLDGVVRVVTSFLDRQRRPNGEFGYWTDERALYDDLDRDVDMFEEALRRPVTEACTDALRPFEDG